MPSLETFLNNVETVLFHFAVSGDEFMNRLPLVISCTQNWKIICFGWWFSYWKWWYLISMFDYPCGMSPNKPFSPGVTQSGFFRSGKHRHIIAKPFNISRCAYIHFKRTCKNSPDQLCLGCRAVRWRGVSGSHGRSGVGTWAAVNIQMLAADKQDMGLSFFKVCKF